MQTEMQTERKTESSINHTSQHLHVLRSIDELRVWRQHQKSGNFTVGFVPTMGALHQGHLNLVRHAQTLADRVLVSIFVNPTQFNQQEDFNAYPVDLETDLRKLQDVGCHAVFLPSVSEMYPYGAQTTVSVGALADYLCGATRAGHFEGVCTVVSLLFNLTQCDWAVFGEKDYQQLTIIRQMVSDLRFPVQIDSCPTTREADGLAMSSRNVRLTEEQRLCAPTIYRALLKAQVAWKTGVRNPQRLEKIVLEQLDDAISIDYLSICHPKNLIPLDLQHQEETALIAIAVLIGPIRLIDNLILKP